MMDNDEYKRISDLRSGKIRRWPDIDVESILLLKQLYWLSSCSDLIQHRLYVDIGNGINIAYDRLVFEVLFN